MAVKGKDIQVGGRYLARLRPGRPPVAVRLEACGMSRVLVRREDTGTAYSIRPSWVVCRLPEGGER